MATLISGGIAANVDGSNTFGWTYVIYDSFDTYPLLSINTPAFVQGVVLSSITANSAAYVYPCFVMDCSSMAYLDAEQPTEIPIVSTAAYIWGVADISVNSSAFVDVSVPISASSAAFVDGIAGIGINSNAWVVGYLETSTSTLAYVCGAETISSLVGGFVHGLDYKTVLLKAYVDASTSISASTNAFIYPWQPDHSISIPAFLNAEDFAYEDGNDFSVHGTVIFTDQQYNRITTLLCDYYLSPSLVVYNVCVVNGTRYKTYNIRTMTSSAWSGKLSITHGANVQYLTDLPNTTAIFPGPMDPNCVMPVAITVINPVISGSTTIPIYISYDV